MVDSEPSPLGQPRSIPIGSTRVCVVGPSTRFLSGISYYTFDLIAALSQRFQVSALLIRRLLPRALYPGAARVGKQLTNIDLPRNVAACDGVDWFWGPSMWRAIRFLRREKPDVVVLQWWTATVLHSYVLLSVVARILGARIVIEFHEVLDTGEQRMRVPFLYARLCAPWLFRLASEYVVHSEADLQLVADRYALRADDITVVPHAVYDVRTEAVPRRDAPAAACNLLYFGVIRPNKGLEDLIRAFSALPREKATKFWLTVVGETWEGCTEPADLIAVSPHSDRITYVDRYVDDAELSGYLAGADVVVLPYRRSSQSGPLHLAMGCGLPVVVTAVGGLVEAVSDYGGAVLVEPGNVRDLTEGILKAAKLKGERFGRPFEWNDTAQSYCGIVLRVLGRSRGSSPSV